MSNVGIISDETDFIKVILQDNYFVIGVLEKLKTTLTCFVGFH